jgi:hypothetical protein
MSYHPSEKEIATLTEVYAVTCAGTFIESLKGANKLIADSSDLSKVERAKIVKEIARLVIAKVSMFLNNQNIKEEKP